ncbi:MAG TPA: PAS domain-containing protein [Bdellovibrionales bacterium]|nr:PAS domain-containing protein [Bdellovibrionales bacterium]
MSEIGSNEQLCTNPTERPFRDLVNAMPLLAWLAEPDGSVSWFNERWFEFTGGTFEEMRGWGWQRAHHPDHLPRVLSVWAEALKTAEPAELQFPLRGRDGQYRWFLSRVAPIKDKGGRVLRWCGTHTDIHEQVRATELLDRTRSEANQLQEILRDKRHQLELAIRAGQLGTFYWNFVTGEATWSDESYRLFGYEDGDRPKVSYELFLSHVDPGERDAVDRRMRETIESGGDFDIEFHARTARGAERWVLGHGRVFKDSNLRASYMLGTMRDITKRKRAQLDYERSVDVSPAILWITDAHGNCTYLSRQWYEFTGQTEHEALGLGWLNSVHPEDREVTSEVFKAANGRHAKFTAHYRLRTAAGEYRWCIDAGNPRYDDNGNYLGYAGTVFDVHDQKIAQDALRLSEARLKEATAISGVGVWEVDAVTGKSWRTPSHDIAYGYDENTSARDVDFFFSRIVPEQREAIRRQFEQCLKTGTTFSAEYRYVRPDGSLRWMSTIGHAVFDMKGRVKSLMGTNRDITNEVEARLAIQESEARARQIANNLPMIVWTATPDGHVDWYNDWWYDYLDLPRGTRWDDPLTNPMHPDDVALTNKLWPEALAKGGTFQMEQRFRRGRDGQYRWHLVRGVPVRDESGKIIKYVGGNVDIHDQKALTEELKKARVAAEVASQAKSSFLANMSHEIRTPMTAILGFTEVLRDTGLSEDERRDAIARIDSSGRGLLRLIDDILDISKIEAGKLAVHRTQFSPLEVATEVVSLLKLSAESKGVSLKLKLDPSTPALAYSDPARLRQVLMNLVGNAVKFTTAGEVVLRVKGEGSRILVYDVCDTGIGISKDDQARLFQPFAQADSSITRRFGGTGLGLLLSKRLSEQLGGGLELTSSEPGRGSQFTARIEAGPFIYGARELQTTVLAPARQDPAAQELMGLRILLAEDVPDNQVLMRLYLESVGAKVEFANNGREAVEKALHDKYDLILMDIQMPLLDGIKATRELRAHGYKRPIVALTAHAMTEEVARSFEAGCDDHLTKPITKRGLTDAVKRHVQSHLH